MLIIDLFSSRLHLIIKANPFSSHSFEYNSFFFFTCFRQFSQYKFPIVLALISSFLFSQLDKNKNVEAERGFTKNKNYRSIVHQKFSNLKSPFTLSSQNSLAINVPGTHANFASQHDAFVSPQLWLSSLSKLPLAFCQLKFFRRNWVDFGIGNDRETSVTIETIHPACWQPVLMARARNQGLVFPQKTA